MVHSLFLCCHPLICSGKSHEKVHHSDAEENAFVIVPQINFQNAMCPGYFYKLCLWQQDTNFVWVSGWETKPVLRERVSFSSWLL